ncbi:MULTISPECIES: DUF1648 domain-containing protein [unclassified Streptomyces]|uniref:DUF1648 domain-containing protein n=1 Tax=unclassified Streptomyces TaxID=2593676 RepID=UPI003803100F
MNRVRYRLVAVSVLPFLLAMAVDLAVFALLRDRLPTRLASHFTAGGSSDSTESRDSYVVFVIVLNTGLAALWSVVAMTADLAVRGGRWMIGVGYALAGLVGYLVAAVLVVNVDAADPTRVSMPPWHPAVAACVALLAAGLGRLLTLMLPLPAPPPPSGAGEPERIDLAEGEVAGWMRRAPSRVLLGVGVALIAGCVVTLYVAGWSRALLPLLAALGCLAFSCPYVTVDRHGLTARPTVLPWPRIRVPLSDVDRATSQEVNVPSEYGGWGYRFRPGRSALVLRSGEAIVVRRRSGREFAVTVDDSATGAALLNTLAHRETPGR